MAKTFLWTIKDSDSGSGSVVAVVLIHVLFEHSSLSQLKVWTAAGGDADGQVMRAEYKPDTDTAPLPLRPPQTLPLHPPLTLPLHPRRPSPSVLHQHVEASADSALLLSFIHDPTESRQGREEGEATGESGYLTSPHCYYGNPVCPSIKTSYLHTHRVSS